MFRSVRRAAALCLLAFVCAARAGAAAELRLVTGSWCPFECEDQEADGLKGYLNEMAAAILAADGTALHFVSTSYLRGIEMVSSGQADLLVGIAREDAPRLVYPELEQGVTGHTFFVKAGDPWRYRGPHSAAELGKIGAMQGYDYAELNEFIARNPHRIELLPGVHRTQRTIQRLMAGRVDAILADSNVVQFQLKRMDRVGALEPAGSLAVVQSVYIGVSPQLPAARELAQRLSRGTRRLRESGELAAILQRYGLRDWKQGAGLEPGRRSTEEGGADRNRWEESRAMESLWERSRHAFERILEDSRKTSERMVEALGDLGDRAKAHLDKARVQRALLKRSAELGSRVYELSRPAAPGARPSTASPLENAGVMELLTELSQLDQELKKLEAQLATRG